MFLPTFLFSTPTSFFLCLLGARQLFIFKFNTVVVYLLLSMILIGSVLIGYYCIGIETVENIKRAVQLMLISSLVFFDYKKIDVDRIKKYILFLVLLFFIYCTVLNYFYINFNYLYNGYIVHLNPSLVGVLDVNYLPLRFSYFFTDPNSFSYFIVFLFAIVIYLEYGRWVTFACGLLAFLLILSTYSRGAFLGFIFVTLTYLIFNKEIKLSLNNTISVFTILIVVIIFVSYYFDYFYSFYEIMEERREVELAMGTGVGGGRLGKWYYFFENINLFPFGVGYTLFVNEQLFRPHSDFIRLNLSYGFMAIFIFLYFFNIFSRKYYFLWGALFIPFLINSVIDDYRLSGIFICLYYLVKNREAVKMEI